MDWLRQRLSDAFHGNQNKKCTLHFNIYTHVHMHTCMITHHADTHNWKIKLSLSSASPSLCEVTVKLLSRVRLCHPMDCSLPDSSVHGILQARGLEWAAMSCVWCTLVFPVQFFSLLLYSILLQGLKGWVGHNYLTSLYTNRLWYAAGKPLS